MPSQIHVHAQPGSFSRWIVLILMLIAFLYSRGWLCLRRTAPTLFPGWRLLGFLGGLPNWVARGSLLFTTRLASSLGGLFGNSIFCWLAGTTTVVVWHIPFFFQLGLSSPAWHTIEDASFICAGLLFWKPIITPPPNEANTPQWSLVLYLFLATVPCDILSAFLAFCGRVVYPYYLSTNQTFTLSALEDQECA